MARLDLLGRPLTQTEMQLFEIYTTLKNVAAQPDLPPCVERNVKHALASMWQVANGLGARPGQLYDVGA